jgi:hypothetical protein
LLPLRNSTILFFHHAMLVPANGYVYTASGAACVFLDNRRKQMLVERLDNAMISTLQWKTSRQTA